MTKVHVLVSCEACHGKAQLPVGEAISSMGESYIQYRPCPQCQGSGKQTRWITLVELRTLMDQEVSRMAQPESSGENEHHQ